MLLYSKSKFITCEYVFFFLLFHFIRDFWLTVKAVGVQITKYASSFHLKLSLHSNVTTYGLFSPFFFQIDSWFHRAHCLFYVSIWTTSRLMGTQPEAPRQSWNILSAGAPRLINGTLDSMINTCASSYSKKIGGNLRWPGIDFFPLSPRTSSPLPSLPCPHPHDHGDYAEARANQSAHQHNFWASFAFHLTAGQFETHMH